MLVMSNRFFFWSLVLIGLICLLGGMLFDWFGIIFIARGMIE